MCYTQPPIAHVMAMTEMRSARELPAREGLQRLEEFRQLVERFTPSAAT
jgi:hypothetical protein